jgi:hypothetical protein
VGSPAAGRLVNGRLPENSTVMTTGRCWPVCDRRNRGSFNGRARGQPRERASIVPLARADCKLQFGMCYYRGAEAKFIATVSSVRSGMRFGGSMASASSKAAARSSLEKLSR